MRFLVGSAMGYLSYGYLNNITPGPDRMLHYFGNILDFRQAQNLAHAIPTLLGGLLAQPIDLKIFDTSFIGKNMLSALVIDSLFTLVGSKNVLIATLASLLNNICLIDFGKKYICNKKDSSDFNWSDLEIIQNNLFAGVFSATDAILFKGSFTYLINGMRSLISSSPISQWLFSPSKKSADQKSSVLTDEKTLKELLEKIKNHEIEIQKLQKNLANHQKEQ